MSDDRKTSIHTSMYKGAKQVPIPEKCNCSRVQLNITVLTTENKVGHNGSMTHVCVLNKGHKEEYCMCGCGFGWRKFKNEN